MTFPPFHLTDRQLRIFEVVLLCILAFGGNILYAAYHFLGLKYGSSYSGGISWLYSSMHEVTALGLLWYILLRRSRSIAELGFSWENKDVIRSVLVGGAGILASTAVYGLIYIARLSTKSHITATATVERVLFGGGVTLMTIVFQFINPFFEELIVRAYLMTEVRQLTNSVSRAVILSTLLQMSYHFYQGATLAFAAGGTFLVFSIYYAKTNRITPVILAHLYMDVYSTLAYVYSNR